MKKSEYLKLPLFSEKMKEMLLGIITKQKTIVPLALNQILQNVEKDYLNKHKEYSKVESIRMLDLRKDGDFFVLSYLPLYKEPEYTVNGKWARKNRQEGKIGRMIRTFLNPYLPLLGSKIKDSDLETFVNGIKSYLSRDTLEFRLVKGNDITKYYLVDNYADFCDSNTLHNSCMSSEDCQTFFDLYTKNPDCEMLIMFDKTVSEEKIVGRAIVWNKDGKKYVDRRYYMLDMYHASMIEHIKSQKWCYKTHNTFANDVSMTFSCPDENGVYETREVELSYSYNPIEIDEYPYMDTLKFWNFNTLSNSEYNLTGKIYELSYTNGDYSDDDDDDDENVICNRCGTSVYYDDARYDSEAGVHYCEQCSQWHMDNENAISIDDAIEVYHLTGWGYVHTEDLDHTVVINDVFYLCDDSFGKERRAYLLDEFSSLTEEEIVELRGSGFIDGVDDNDRKVIYLPYDYVKKTN